MRKYRFLLIFFSLMAGCTSAPYERPKVDLPAAWSASAQKGVAPGERWWMLYGDRPLDTLVGEALEHNRDLALAAARVDEARALSRVADSLLYPAIDATVQRDRTRSSERTLLPIPANAIERNNYRAQLNVAYELDLWGRLRSAGDAARAELLATQAAQESAIRSSKSASRTTNSRLSIAHASYGSPPSTTARSRMAIFTRGFEGTPSMSSWGFSASPTSG